MNTLKKIRSILLALIISISLAFPIHSQNNMIADITEDVTTEFGVYHPHLVTVTPEAIQYDLKPDFSNVVNFHEFDFTDKEKELLLQNKFFVSPKRNTDNSSGYKEIYDIYNECRELGIPIFVTTDAVLHTFHLCFDRILRTVELEKFFMDLEGLLAALFDQTVQQYDAATDSLIRRILLRNLEYLVVARTLLDPDYVASIDGEKFLEELRLIGEHKGYCYSPLFGYREDYSQYKPRGHYTRNDSLKCYFRSMMWLGRGTFVMDPGEEPETTRSHTLSALLLIQALEKSLVNGESAHAVWERIYSPTVFLVGKTDDLNMYQYYGIAQNIYDNFLTMTSDEFGDLVSLDAFINEADKLPGPRITTDTPKGFRLMGQRFVPDSWVFDELVMLKVPRRIMPKSLDVMYVLGSQRSHQLLEEMGEFATYPEYAVKLDSLRNVFENYPDETWAQNLYWNWLYSLMPLLFPKSTGYPIFMQSGAWTDKDLFAALGSWAELRHDTILYVKQSTTLRGHSDRSDLIQGYVEPNPQLYARLAALTDFFIKGLEKYDLLFSSFQAILQKLSELGLSLKTISEKELTNQSLNPEEYELINNFGKTIEGIAEFDLNTRGPEQDSDEEIPVVADVHTDTNTDRCLEVGVGYPFNIFVICSIEGELKIARGAGFSFYEFILPISQRLTDEEWRDLLKSNMPPNLPYWTKSFLDLKSSFTNDQPDFYKLKKGDLQGITVSVSAGTIQTNESLTVNCKVRPLCANCPVEIGIVGPEDSLLINVQTDESGNAQSVQSNLKPGHYWVTAKAALPEAAEPCRYRTSFKVVSTTGVAENSTYELPEVFHLEQNYPNPFAPGAYSGENLSGNTSIRFQLPVPAYTKLIIYNIRGEKVRTLFVGHKAPGHHEIHWDGMDENGHVVAAGVYFYHLQVGSVTFSKKMVLVF